jgi:serine/threonine protein kinase
MERTNEEVIAVITQIVHGVRYMHSNHILHRDIKPENILFHNDMIKICDFGFSIMIKEHHDMMRTICGTPLFMSPEILFLRQYTSKCDIWSLGVLFYMMIYRLHPYGTLTSLDEYRIKIKRPVIFIPIDELSYLIDIVKLMLSQDESTRPDIGTIACMLQYRSTDLSDTPVELVVIRERDERDECDERDERNERNERKEETKEELLQRINELQEEIFELEERSESSSCCFGMNVTEVTGRGRTNKGYELAITNDYFTPPESTFGGVAIPQMARTSLDGSRGSRGSKGSRGSNGSTPNSFLSSSIEKLSALFHSLRPKSSSYSGF